MNVSGIFSNNVGLLGVGQRNDGRAARVDRLNQIRNQMRSQEAQVQKREDAQIRRINAQISEIRFNSDVSVESRTKALNNLEMRIQRILEVRAEREVEFAGKDAMIDQMLMKENTSVEKRETRDEVCYEDEEETEARAERRQMADLAEADMSVSNLHTLRSTHNSLSSEAMHLRHAMDSESANFTKIGVVPRGNYIDVDIIISRNPMRGTDNWVNNQYTNLNRAMARTDAMINSAIASMYRDSVQMQESQLAQYRQEQEQNHSLDGDDEAHGYDAEA